MTEYDYSPEAYERYTATQNRIARWVDYTQQFSPENPFMPASHSPHPIPFDNLYLQRKSHPPLRSAPLAEPRIGSDFPNRPHHHRQRSASSTFHGMQHGVASNYTHSSYMRSIASRGQPHPSTSTNSFQSSTDRSPSLVSSVSRTNTYDSRTTSSSLSSGYPHQENFHPQSFHHPTFAPRAPTGVSVGYSLVYPNPGQPTVVQPLKDQPIVIPMDGGRGGYVVIPPIGMSATVVPSASSKSKRNSIGAAHTKAQRKEEDQLESEDDGQSFFGRLTKKKSKASIVALDSVSITSKGTGGRRSSKRSSKQKSEEWQMV